MSYTPMTAEEAAKLNLRPEGIYPFEVTDAKAGVSKEKQNPMIALVLRFFDADGSSFTVKDWLVHSENRWAEKKCYDFALSAGLLSKYATGSMTAEDCLGRGGFAMIGVEKGKAKADGSGSFPDRNNIKYYTITKPKPAAPVVDTQAPDKTAAPMVRNADLDEDVPF
jgi:hypothetical protein